MNGADSLQAGQYNTRITEPQHGVREIVNCTLPSEVTNAQIVCVCVSNSKCNAAIANSKLESLFMPKHLSSIKRSDK
jgi:hypothetical protein